MSSMRMADGGWRSTSQRVRNFAAAVAILWLVGIASIGWAEDKPPQFVTATIRGRVVFLAEAMERQSGVPSVPEARDRILALQTSQGDLIPLIEDSRGRAFRRDERLREMEVELLVRRYRGSPVAQILRVCELAKDGKYELDYWCDICAIAMFELKDCDCCQGPVELRRRKTEE